MQQPSRRTLLAGTGAALALGGAGWLAQGQPDDEPADDETDALPSGLAATLEYVYPSTDEGTVLRITRVPENPQRDPGRYHPRLTEFGEPEWVVVDGALSGGSGIVATGSFDLDADTEEYSADGSRGSFDLYRVGDADEDVERDRLATDGETLLLGSSDWVSSALDRASADEPTYLESTDGVRSLLGVADFAGQTTLVDDEEQIRTPFERTEIDPDHYPDRLLASFTRTDDSISYTLAGWYANLPEDGATEPVESYLSTQLSMEQIATDVREDDNVVVASGSRPYTPPEERPETAGHPRFHGYDAEADEILFRFDRGEQLPVDHYEIEIDDEVYDGDWARGQDEIGEGSVIGVDAAAVEPGDHFTVSYDSPDDSYGSSSGTTVLRNLPFAVDFAPDERTGELRYVEGPPLDADRIAVVVDGEEDAAREPWSGELQSGDTATLSDLSIEGHVVVRYERTDDDPVRIGGASYGPPGHFAFEYDGRNERLTIAYPDFEDRVSNRRHPAMGHRQDQEPLDAERFEITVDGEPADRQWTDVDGEVEPGSELELADVPVDTAVSVDWIGGDGTRHVIDRTHTVPDVEFSYGYDAEAGELTVTHAGGQPVDAEKLGLRFHSDGERTVAWDDDDGTVSEGDDVVVDDVPEHGFVVVNYGETHLDHSSVGRLREAE